MPVVHAVFDVPASGHLKQVLRILGRAERVIALIDDLSVGPIDRTGGEARAHWLQKQFGEDAFERAADIDRLWSEIASLEHHVVAYLSRDNPWEYSGLHELLRRRGDSPLEIVDITNVDFGPGEKPLGIGQLSAEQAIEHRVLESKAPLPVIEKQSFTRRWAKLQAENAPLRIICDGDLVSAPMTHVDASVMSYATVDWQSAVRLLGAFHDDQHDNGIVAPQLRFLLWRLRALVESGQLEARGELTLHGFSSAEVVLARR